ncbi:MAG: hypothetical protein POELPBGB_02961 [Bacteroidia bacterium]|nr:hypothetical protein [Bacteroidia bacterium]
MADQIEHKKALFRDRKKRYRSRHKSVTLSFSMDFAKRLQKEADQYDKTFPDFIKSLVAAHMEGTGYILPKDSNLQTLLLALRRIGNNVNQLTRYVHTEGLLKERDITTMQQHLLEVEREIKIALAQPPSITNMLSEYLSKYPEKVSSLKNWLNDYQSDSGKE